MSLPRVICVVGPTSSGKTSLSLALAKEFDGEIINADARQLYRGFDVGTGKPFLEERNGVPHYLFDEDPSVQMTVTQWREKALACLNDIVMRSHVPIVVGGTGLYIQALIDNFSIAAVEPQEYIRKELSLLSLAELVERLRIVDPEASEVVDKQNPRRVIRALEVAMTTGTSFVRHRQKGEPFVKALQIGIQRTREELYARAEAQVDTMILHGWIEEVRGLLSQGLTKDVPAMSAIGYRELMDVIECRRVLEEVLPLIKQYTRNYIKRQITWFKRDKSIHWVKGEAEARVLVEEFLKNL